MMSANDFSKRKCKTVIASGTATNTTKIIFILLRADYMPNEQNRILDIISKLNFNVQLTKLYDIFFTFL